MKVNIFNGYYDTDPKESTLEEIVRLVKQDVSLQERTEKHRYFLELGLTKEAKAEKASCLNMAVAARFRGGKELKHIYELTFVGMVEFDHLEPSEMPALLEKGPDGYAYADGACVYRACWGARAILLRGNESYGCRP